jgi:hypothetical protein
MGVIVCLLPGLVRALSPPQIADGCSRYVCNTSQSYRCPAWITIRDTFLMVAVPQHREGQFASTARRRGSIFRIASFLTVCLLLLLVDVSIPLPRGSSSSLEHGLALRLNL